jgi:hypothetical protein
MKRGLPSIRSRSSRTGGLCSVRIVSTMICGLYSYLELSKLYPDWHGTPVGAYFTHFQASSMVQGAEAVDLSTPGASQYIGLLASFGLVAIVGSPPVAEAVRQLA